MAQVAYLTEQEKRIESGHGQMSPRSRINGFLSKFRDQVPRIDIQRAVLFTESMSQTEEYPMNIRRAKALHHIFNHIDVVIEDNELIVGTCGGAGRHSILFPELRGPWLEKALKAAKEGNGYRITDKEIQIIKEKVIPYWKGKSAHERYLSMLPNETKELIYGDDDWGSAGLLQDNANINATLNWAGHYKKVIDKGLLAIKKEMEERLSQVRNNDYNKKAFLQSAIIVCDGLIDYAKRYAKRARELASMERDLVRKKELETIAQNCEWIPAHPARNFWEALQCQWFVQTAYKLEQPTVGVISLGRFDQYMYPTFIKDYKAGVIDEEKALELMECLWFKIANYVPYNVTATNNYFEGYCHFEQTVLGGQTRYGQDASNELTYLVLRSKKEFPLHYPDLSVRVHSRTPDRLLYAIVELIKEGTGFPKLLNDEEIIPQLLHDGANTHDARDYTPCACTEVRLLDLDTYVTVGCNPNTVAALEMAINDGVVTIDGKKKKLMTPSIKFSDIKTYEDVLNNFTEAWDFLVKHYYIRQAALEISNAACLAAPFMSMLNDACVEALTDIHQPIFGIGLSKDTGNLSVIGFGTVIESLTAIKKLIFEDKAFDLEKLKEALETNFEDHERIRQMLLNVPQYGNNEHYADEIARQVDEIICGVMQCYQTPNGPQNLKFVPVTTHVAMGKRMGATPNGRKAGEAFSEGVSPTQGRDSQGPLATLISIAKAKSRKYNNNLARLVNIKISPQVLSGEKGTRDLMELIRTFVDLKLWHIQFFVINKSTLLKAQKNPEKYRNLIVRVAGYSAYFTELSPNLQNEIINRTEHQLC
ncbi:glycyl radical protein [Desulfitibacter alkalitolerans]|uniref:glycyl radical protein n=1 Tax=Desulfitibacter alkalitolerans TaxID=264641 RepID=UPI00048185B1|nr:pyruvate formate lyase family protein [Desulfitibacter alkalitolerans]